MGPQARADRGVSEFAGVAILVSVTILVTASIGVFVLVVDTEAGGPPDANFSFRYIDSSSALIVTHDRGDAVTAGNLTVRSEVASARWDELAGTNETALVGPGDSVQVSSSNAYGANVSRRETVRVVYTPTDGNETVLERWNGG
jgi:hypothetical protein